MFTKAVLLAFSVIGTIAGMLGIYQIRASTLMVTKVNCTENITTLKVLHPKPRATCIVEAEIEKDDSYDVNLLRFTGSFGFVYLAFLLLAGIDYVSTGDGLLMYEGWVTIMMGILGFVEISFIITFLAQLKRKVTYSIKPLRNNQLSD